MAEQLSSRAFLDALVGELTGAVDAILGGVAAVPSASPASGEGWRIEATAGGDLDGALVAWVDQAGGGLMTARVLGMDEAPDDGAILDMLGEMWGQAAGALSLKEPFTGVRLSMMPAGPGDAPIGAMAYELAAGDGTPLARVAIVGDLTLAAKPVPVAPEPRPAAPGGVVPPERLDVVLDIELPLVVRFARTVMTMKALAALGPGSIVDMERSPDEPVQLLVGDRVIARGEVVVVGGNYGVRVTELASQSERARAVEAEKLW